MLPPVLYGGHIQRLELTYRHVCNIFRHRAQKVHGALVEVGSLDVSASDGRGLWIYEGALSFVTVICVSCRDSPYKREWGGTVTKFPRLNRPGAVARLAVH